MTDDEHLEDLEGDEFSPERIAEAVGRAARVRSHLGKDFEDQCGYCGQHFGPDDIAVEKEVLGRKWRFCDAQCLADFHEHADFQDENLDGDQDAINVRQDLEDEL